MSFDWPRFFEQHHIEYVTSGPNTARGQISVRCPWCGVRDPSQHLSVSLDGKGYRCWRNHEHRGKHPAYLIQALLQCTLDHAFSLVGGTVVIPSDLQAMVNQYLQPQGEKKTKKPKLVLPKEFLPFREVPSARIFVRYMQGRGFDDRAVMNLTKWYDLRYCTRGSFRGRVIFPVEYQGDLVCWTGRTVYDTHLRYKTLSPDPDEDDPDPAAMGPLPHYLLWYDDLLEADADTLVLVEGPLDALKVSILGRPYGIVSTCFFTSGPSREQVDLLHELLPRFKRRYLFLDPGSVGPSMKAVADLTGLGVEVIHPRIKVEDPGAMTTKQFKQIFDLHQ